MKITNFSILVEQLRQIRSQFNYQESLKQVIIWSVLYKSGF